MEKVLVNAGGVTRKVQIGKYQRALSDRISNQLHHLIFWKPLSKRFDLTQNHPPPLSRFYSRLPPSKRSLPWYFFFTNLCTYLSYNDIIISSMALFCHFSLEQGIIQCLLVMRCNQILGSLSASDKYDFVICARSRNYAFHRSVIQADKKTG
jgi:hypothetical protein